MALMGVQHEEQPFVPGSPYYPHMEWVTWGRFGYACGCEKGRDHDS